MELNGKTFESFRKLADEFDQDCFERDEDCSECNYNEIGESGIKCFANWLDEKFRESDQAEDEEAQWNYELERRAKMSEYLKTKGFSLEQAVAIGAILSDFVMKPKEQIEKEAELEEKKAKERIKEMFGDGTFFEDIGKAIRKGIDAAMKDQEEDKDE